MTLRLLPAYKPNRIQPVGGVLPSDKLVFDGGAGCHFVPRTAYIGLEAVAVSNARQTGTFGGVTTGWVDLEFSGLRAGMAYVRRFSLYSWQQVRIPLTFEGAALRIVAPSAALRGFALAASLTDEEVSGGAESDPVLWYATEDLVAGTYRVPVGAVEMVASTPDPGFGWVAFGDTDKTVTVASPAFAGVPQPVVGSLYTTTAAAFRAAWRVRI